MANERVSDERLAEMLSRVSPPADGWSAGLPTMDVASIITELQALRSPHQGEVEAVAYVNALVLRHHVESKSHQTTAVLHRDKGRLYGEDDVPLYAQPSVPKAGEVTDEMIGLGKAWFDANFNGCPDTETLVEGILTAALVQP